MSQLDLAINRLDAAMARLDAAVAESAARGEKDRELLQSELAILRPPDLTRIQVFGGFH